MEKENELIEKIKTLNSEREEKFKSEMAEIKDKLKSISEEEIVKLSESIEKMKNITKEQKTRREIILAELEKKKSELENLVKVRSGSVDIYKEKTITSMGVNIVQPTTPVVQFNAGSKIESRVRLAAIMNFITQSEISTPYYIYNDLDVSAIGDVRTDEATPKARITANLKSYTAIPQKATAVEDITTEAVTDLTNIASTIDTVLQDICKLKKAKELLRIVKEKAIAVTTGTIIKLSPTNTLKDVILELANNIVNYDNTAFPEQKEFIPNVALVNWTDYLKMSVTKDATEAYLFAENIRETMGIQIIPCHRNDIAPGELIVGDFTQASIFNYGGYESRVGYDSGGFITNTLTVIGEERYIPLVKANATGAFAKCILGNFIS